MPSFHIYRQFTPVTIRPPRNGDDGEYRASFLHVDTVRADDGDEAIEIARTEYHIRAPVVQRVLH